MKKLRKCPKRAVLLMLASVLTTAGAWAQSGYDYMGADGTLYNTATDDIEENDNPIVLEGSESTLAPGWYVVCNTTDGVDLNYTSGLSCSEGDLNIILCDGAEMGVSVGRYGVALNTTGEHTLTIFGQALGTGQLSLTGSDWGNAIEGDTIIINGGTINATNTDNGNDVISIKGSLTINGGTVNVTINNTYGISGKLTLNAGLLNVRNTSEGSSNYCVYGDFTVNGGQFIGTSVGGVVVAGTTRFNGGTFRATSENGMAVCSYPLYLNWTNLSDSFYANSFDTMSPEVAEGKLFIDEEGNVYSGRYDDGTYYGNIYSGDICGKTLRPFDAFPPKNLTATVIAPTSAVLTWEAGSDEILWQVRWSTDEGETWSEPVMVSDTPQYEITGISPETTVLVEVLSVYSEEKRSFAVRTSFTTLASNPMPLDVAATNLMPTTATIRWRGYGDSYNVRYRTILITELLSENFEGSSLPDGWTFTSMNTENEVRTGVEKGIGTNDTYGFRFSSFSSANDYNQYLISPELAVAGKLQFNYKKSENGTELFKVGYSTTTSSLDAFTWGNEIEASSQSWETYEQKLPEDVKYIAINYCSNYMYDLDIDNITIKSEITGDWINTSTEEPAINLTGLTAGTSYQCQLQSIKEGEADSEWSANCLFSTLQGLDITFAPEGFATRYEGEHDMVLPQGMKARIITESEDNEEMTYETIANGDRDDRTVPAGTAVMLQVAPADTPQTITVGLATPAAPAIAQTNLLHGSDTETTTTGDGEGEYKFYKLTYGDEGTEDADLFAWYFAEVDGRSFTSPAHKAWLAIPNTAYSSRLIGLPDFEEATSVAGITVNSEGASAPAGWYTFDGRKLNMKPTEKGLYINKGKKVIIK